MSIVLEMDNEHFTNLLLADSYANWSKEGAEALYRYYEELSDEIGEPFKFDRVGIRCDWYEYDNALEAYNEQHGTDEFVAVDKDNTAENAEAQALEWLEDNTTVLEADNGHVLVMAF